MSSSQLKVKRRLGMRAEGSEHCVLDITEPPCCDFTVGMTNGALADLIECNAK